MALFEKSKKLIYWLSDIGTVPFGTFLKHKLATR